MNKNDAISQLQAMHTFRATEQARYIELANAEQSPDEVKELLDLAQKQKTHCKYLARILDNAVLCDAVAAQISVLKISADQLTDIEKDAYSMRKLAELLISFVQKRKVNDEHSFSEALAVIASGVTDVDATAFGAKMTTRDGKKYKARQAQMSLKLLERLHACTVKQDGKNKLFCMNTDSAVYKRIMRAYE